MKTRGRRQSANLIDNSSGLIEASSKPGEYMPGWEHSTAEFPKSKKQGRLPRPSTETTSSIGDERTKYAK
jgi:hypothetical protein